MAKRVRACHLNLTAIVEKLRHDSPMIKPAHHLSYRKTGDGGAVSLYLEDVAIDSALAQFGSPLYLYSSQSVTDSYRRLKSALGALPVQICFAVKANSNLHLLRHVSSLGAGCDLVSFGEWVRAKEARIPASLRVLSGLVKTKAELTRILSEPDGGVGSIHVESLMELDLISAVATQLQKKVTIAFRYNPDVDAKTLDRISTGRKKDKFGMNLEEIKEGTIRLQSQPWLNLQGISIHIGSQITVLSPYEKAFRQLKKCVAMVEKIQNQKLSYVDLGGGFGVQYQDETPLSMRAYAALVRQYFRDVPRILIEPGRSLVANCGFLASTVVFSKKRPGHQTLILDSAMNDLMRPALYDAHHQIWPVTKGGKRAVRKSRWDIVGGVCETTDYFSRDRPLAVRGEPGEKVLILSAGAYGFSMSGTYNTRPRLAEVWVEGDRVKLIRKRETIDDLIRDEISISGPNADSNFEFVPSP